MTNMDVFYLSIRCVALRRVPQTPTLHSSLLQRRLLLLREWMRLPHRVQKGTDPYLIDFKGMTRVHAVALCHAWVEGGSDAFRVNVGSSNCLVLFLLKQHSTQYSIFECACILDILYSIHSNSCYELLAHLSRNQLLMLFCHVLIAFAMLFVDFPAGFFLSVIPLAVAADKEKELNKPVGLISFLCQSLCLVFALMTIAHQIKRIGQGSDY